MSGVLNYLKTLKRDTRTDWSNVGSKFVRAVSRLGRVSERSFVDETKWCYLDVARIVLGPDWEKVETMCLNTAPNFKLTWAQVTEKIPLEKVEVLSVVVVSIVRIYLSRSSKGSGVENSRTVRGRRVHSVEYEVGWEVEAVGEPSCDLGLGISDIVRVVAPGAGWGLAMF